MKRTIILLSLLPVFVDGMDQNSYKKGLKNQPSFKERAVELKNIYSNLSFDKIQKFQKRREIKKLFLDMHSAKDLLLCLINKTVSLRLDQQRVKEIDKGQLKSFLYLFSYVKRYSSQEMYENFSKHFFKHNFYGSKESFLKGLYTYLQKGPKKLFCDYDKGIGFADAYTFITLLENSGALQNVVQKPCNKGSLFHQALQSYVLFKDQQRTIKQCYNVIATSFLNLMDNKTKTDLLDYYIEYEICSCISEVLNKDNDSKKHHALLQLLESDLSIVEGLQELAKLGISFEAWIVEKLLETISPANLDTIVKHADLIRKKYNLNGHNCRIVCLGQSMSYTILIAAFLDWLEGKEVDPYVWAAFSGNFTHKNLHCANIYKHSESFQLYQEQYKNYLKNCNVDIEDRNATIVFCDQIENGLGFKAVTETLGIDGNCLPNNIKIHRQYGSKPLEYRLKCIEQGLSDNLIVDSEVDRKATGSNDLYQFFLAIDNEALRLVPSYNIYNWLWNNPADFELQEEAKNLIYIIFDYIINNYKKLDVQINEERLKELCN